ncbi:MAG: adenylate/guanylate cyclase domain-containing protein, partial [Candidatus Korobacteraceae bacterium]
DPDMPDITVRAKYVFLDIVNYSHGRSAEAQADIITVLNRVVDESTQATALAKEQYLYLPTGDGICIAILDPAARYDIHLEIALSILERVAAHNDSTEDTMRQFQVRIGLNENVDNRVTDINGDLNIAGAGINTAQRIMSAGDGGQIIVGESVYETLRHHEKYMRSFHNYPFPAKHGVLVPVHQFIADHSYLNVEIPSVFRVEAKSEEKLTKLAAYYVAHAVRNRASILKKGGNLKTKYAGPVLLFFLAYDSVYLSERKVFDYESRRAYGAGRLTFDQQLEFYLGQEFWIIHQLSVYVKEQLSRYLRVFEDREAVFVNKSGLSRLKEEWPDIWEEFEFGKDT